MSAKITSPQELSKLREQTRSALDVRSGPKEMKITVHMGTCGIAAGARDVMAELADQLDKKGIRNVTLRQSGCIGLCDKEPMLTLTDATGGLFRYGKLDAPKARRVVQEHVLHGRCVQEFLIKI